jgi:shikimate 5-dehydrogenase
VLDRLLAHKDHEAYKITVFTRQEDKARKLEDLFPVATIIGSLDDAKILEDAASKADVVINTVRASGVMHSAVAERNI